MAYSDYGGFAYRNGELQESRRDVVLTPEDLKATPGMWPGWILEEGRAGGSYHAVLGDGPIFVTLYKQSSFGLYRLGEKLDPIPLMVDPQEGDTAEYDGKTYVKTGRFRDRSCRFSIDGHQIELWWRVEDNHYQYCRLTQPDGTIWTGWSGYGVGAGFDGEYGYSNEDRDETLGRLCQQAA